MILLQAADVARAAHSAFRTAYGPSGGPLVSDPDQLWRNFNARQNTVDFIVSDSDQGMGLPEFVETFVHPAMCKLADAAGPHRVFSELDIPPNCWSARYTDDNISIRVMAAKHSFAIVNEQGEIIGYEEPKLVCRFDVLTVPT